MEGPYFSKLAIYYFWLLWVFVAVTVFLWFWRAGTTLYLWCEASHCSGFSCRGAQALESVGFSSDSSWALEQRLNVCDARI